MTRVQKITVRQSELRQEISGLLDTEAEKRAEDHDAKLKAATTELRTLESDLQAAMLVEDDPEEKTTGGDSESRAYDGLIEKADLSSYFDSTVMQRSLDGAEKELNGYLKLQDNQIPLDLIVEKRAITPAPADVGTTQAPIIASIFPRGVAAFLVSRRHECRLENGAIPSSRPTPRSGLRTRVQTKGRRPAVLR